MYREKTISKSMKALLAVLIVMGGMILFGSFGSIKADAAADLANNSTVSKAKIDLGQTVTINGKASGGKSPYTFAYYYKLSSATNWKLGQDYSSKNSYEFKPAASGDYDVVVRAKDSAGTVAKKSLSFKVNPALVNNSKLSKTEVNLGGAFTIYGKASGGSGGYTFAYLYKKSTATNWKTAQDYSTSASYVLKPESSGDYDIVVRAKDSYGMVVKKTLSIKVNPALTSKSRISKTRITRGQSVTAVAVGKGGAGEYQFAFYYKRSTSSSWISVKDFSTEDRAEIKPSGTYDYNILVKIKDKLGSVARQEFSFHVDPTLTVEAELSATEIKPDEKVTVSAYASGGNDDDYWYSFYYKKTTDSNWTLLMDYSDYYNGKIFSLTVPGDYQVRCKAKDANGAIARSTVNLKVASSALDAKVDSIISKIITSGMDDFDKVKAIHDWIINNTRYDTEGYNSGNVPQSSYSAEGVFNYGVAVCDGYAKAFLLMANKAGLEVIRVTGMGYTSSGSENHAWNQVKVSGNWYNIDVTWDDPAMADGSDRLDYDYFLIPDSVMDQDHVADSTKYTCTTAQPTSRLTTALINDFKKQENSAYCSKKSEIGTAVNNFVSKNTLQFTLLYKTTGDANSVFSDVFEYCPAGYRMRASVSSWKLSGYYEVSVTLTKS